MLDTVKMFLSRHLKRHRFGLKKNVLRKIQEPQNYGSHLPAKCEGKDFLNAELGRLQLMMILVNLLDGIIELDITARLITLFHPIQIKRQSRF